MFRSAASVTAPARLRVARSAEEGGGLDRRARRRGARGLASPGTLVELGLEGMDRIWRTRVEDAEEDSLLVVAPTYRDGAPYPADEDRTVLLTWVTDAGLVRAQGSVTGTDVDVVPRWWITVVSLAREQRRGAFRLRIARPVRVAVDGSQLSGVTRDLSETGALVVVPAPVTAQIGQQVRVRIALTPEEELLLNAEVVRVAGAVHGQDGLGLRFIGLDEQLADRVRRFVLQEQFRIRGSGSGPV